MGCRKLCGGVLLEVVRVVELRVGMINISGIEQERLWQRGWDGVSSLLKADHRNTLLQLLCRWISEPWSSVSSDIYHPQCAPIHMSHFLRRHLVIPFVKLRQLCVAYSFSFSGQPPRPRFRSDPYSVTTSGYARPRYLLRMLTRTVFRYAWHCPFKTIDSRSNPCSNGVH